jgi:hypothetical protein
MDIEYFRCNTCGKDIRRLKFRGRTPCFGNNMCCDCCKKKGLQSEKCKLDWLELKLIEEGKELNQNEIKGLLLERAMSDTLKKLNIPHKHNPFKLYYSNYQAKNPDIVIEQLDAIIECKNLSKRQVEKSISPKWLDKHIINRPNSSKYCLKMALFSYKPPVPLIKYLKKYNWKVYGLGFQILNLKQEKKAIPRLKQQFWWLTKKKQQRQDSDRK